MKGLLAGLLAAGMAWVVNSWVANQGNPRLLIILPFVEELLKTYVAVLFGGSVWLSHFTFGSVEAVYDLAKHARENVSASVISFLGHAGFGFLTVLVYVVTGEWLVAVLSSAMVHTAWNYLVLHEFARR
ncbi:MAG: hypothetical protein HPY81_05515 [Firmicutes bacterium]|nr:hypothetical protein [Bacillota bacterium]